MESEGEDTGKVPVVVANDAVRFQVPALDHLVLPGGEHVRVALGDGEAANGVDVAGQGEEEGVGGGGGELGEGPELDGAVGGAGYEELVEGVDGDGADPAEVAGDHGGELPGGVVGGSDDLREERKDG